VTAEVITALSRLGKKDEARGLAELAWRRSPGDGAVAQARADAARAESARRRSGIFESR
jgi:hypothetical protein